MTTRASGKDKALQIVAKPSAAEVAFTLLYDGADVSVIIGGHEKEIRAQGNATGSADQLFDG